jgi:hypothetical protein
LRILVKINERKERKRTRGGKTRRAAATTKRGELTLVIIN